MPSNTPNLNLYKGTPGSTTETFNIETMLNDNFDKIDAADGQNVKKETDKGLSTEDYTTAEKIKLAGIEGSANNYQHPATHSPSIITQDANYRFVTDTEKADWNAKETPAGAQAKVDVVLEDIVTQATPNKILKLNNESKLPATALNADKVNNVYFRNNNGSLEWSVDNETWNSVGGGIDFEYGLVPY